MLTDERGEYMTKQAGERLDFTIDWTVELAGDTIVTSTWVVPTGITQTTPVPSNTDQTTTIWLLGGTVGAEYELVNTVVTAAPRTFTRSLRVKIVAGVELPSTYTLDQLAELRKAYASGVTSIEYDGRRVTYRNLQEMEQVIRAVEKVVSAGISATVRRITLAQYRGDR